MNDVRPTNKIAETSPLTPEEEAELRKLVETPVLFPGQGDTLRSFRRLFATLDAARSERDGESPE